MIGAARVAFFVQRVSSGRPTSTRHEQRTLANCWTQRVRRTFLEAVNGDDVETNEKGEVELHGVTVAAWTSKIPA